MSPPPAAPAPPSPPSSSSSDHPLSVLTHTLLTSPLSTRLLDDSSSLLTRRIRQASSRHRTLSRLDSLRAQLASSLESGGSSDKNEWADRYARGLEDFERDWNSSSSSSSPSTGGSRDETWSKLPSFAGKVAVGGLRALLEDPFKTGKHLSSLGADVFVKTQGDSEVEVVLELVYSLLGSEAVLKLVEGFAVGVVQELVGEEGGGGGTKSSSSSTSTSTSDPARQRELESCFVSMMSLVHEMGLEVVGSDTQEDVVPRGGSPFAFGKSLELVLLEALAAQDPSSSPSDSNRPSSTQKRPPPLARNHLSSLSTSTEEAGWGATFSSMILGAPPSSPGPSADFPWAKRGGWIPAGGDAASQYSVQMQREPGGGLLRADTRSISGPSPILKSPLGGRMFRSPSLSSFGSSSVADSSSNSAVKPFTSLAASVLRLLSRPTSPNDATSPPKSTTTTTLPLLQALSISLLRTHFPFSTHPKSHRRLLLLLIVRWYSFSLLQRVLTGSTTSPPLPLPDRGVSLTSVQGDAPNLKFAGAGAGGKGRGPLLGDVWKGEKGGAKLDKLHLRVHLALVEAAGFGNAGSSASNGAGSSGKLGAGYGEEDEEELGRAAKRVLEAFGAGVALSKTNVEAEIQDASSPKIEGPTGSTGIEVETLNALELSLKELLSLLRIARPLVVFSNSLGSSGGGGGLAGFRRGSDFKGGRFNATGAGRWGASSSSDTVFAEEDYDVVQEGIARIDSQPSSSRSVILFASPSPTQGTFSLSFSIPELEKFSSLPVQSTSPSMGRNGGTYGTTPAKGGRRGSAASTTSYNSPTMSPSLDGGSDYFGLPMVLEELSEEGDIGKLEKEVIFRALLNLVKDGHLSTLPSSQPFPELIPLLAQAAESSQDSFDFANTLSYRQALEGLTQVTKNHPHLALRNFAPLLSPLIASAVAAESTKAAQLQLVQTRLLEVDQKESALLLGARRVISALNDLRTRAYFVLEVLPSERIERLRLTVAEIKLGEMDFDDEGEVTTWLAETNLAVDFSVGETKLHASCFLVDRALRRVADPKVLFQSSLWKREAVLAGPFLEEDPFVAPPTTNPTSTTSSSSPSTSTSLSCLSFGAISTSLLRPGEPQSPQLSYLNTFILRLRTRITGYLLAELESQGDITFPADTWFEKESYLLPGASSIIPKEWTSPLLRTFLLHPSPHAKLQALFSLEMLCVSQKVAPFTSPTPSDETTGLPPSLSFSSTVRTTPPRHTLRDPKSSSGASPTMHRISRAIDNHPHHSTNEAVGGGGAGTASAGGGVVPDAFWSLGASLSSYVFGAPAAGSGAGGGGGTKLDSREVRDSSSSLLEPPNTDELVDELSKIVVRHRPENLSSCLVKIAFFVPGEILDFRPEGKAYLDFGLACLTLRTDLLDILHAEAKEIIRKGGYASKEERARALELLDVCAREGSDEARREVRSLMSPWVGGGGGGLGM